MSQKSGCCLIKRYTQPENRALTSGVSEVIGSFLLISIVVLAIAIIAVVLFSQTGPQEIPNVNFMVGTDNKISPTLYLYHNGGDPLNISEFTVLVDGSPVPNPQIVGGGSVWSLGKSLYVTLSSGSVPKNVVLVYNKTGANSVVLRSASVNVATMPGNISPDIISGSVFPPVIDITQLTQNVNNRSIVFYRENGTTLSGTLQFNVTRLNSTINTNSSGVLPLDVGSTVLITTSSTQSFRVDGIGDQLLELTADSVNLQITNRSSGNIPSRGVTINHTWITGYKDMQSTLILTTTSGIYPTALVVNNYPSVDKMQQFTGQIVNQPMDNPNIVITNARPTNVGFFILQYDKIRGMYFAGDASGVTWNSNQIYP